MVVIRPNIEACVVQEHHKSWMHDPMNKLDGEAVEKEVASNVRTMHKTGKAFAQRGLQAYAANCDSIKADIEEFQKVVPLLVVSDSSEARMRTDGLSLAVASTRAAAHSAFGHQRQAWVDNEALLNHP